MCWAVEACVLNNAQNMLYVSYTVFTSNERLFRAVTCLSHSHQCYSSEIKSDIMSSTHVRLQPCTNILKHSCQLKLWLLAQTYDAVILVFLETADVLLKNEHTKHTCLTYAFYRSQRVQSGCCQVLSWSIWLVTSNVGLVLVVCVSITYFYLAGEF